jgi:hypothetical protein
MQQVQLGQPNNEGGDEDGQLPSASGNLGRAPSQIIHQEWSSQRGSANTVRPST